MRFLPRLRSAPLGALTAAVALAASASTAFAQDQTVAMVDFDFEPNEVTVNVGDTVTWTNEGDAPHTATDRDGAWDTGTVDPGGSASITFETAGTYEYFCEIHPQMVGTVVVEEAAEQPTEEPTEEPTDDGETPAAEQPETSTRPDEGGTSGGVPGALAVLLIGAAGLVGAVAVRRRFTAR